jgi:hypothetical protein
LLKRQGKGAVDNRVLVAMVKVEWERRNVGPVCIGKVVISVYAAIQVLAFPMKPKPSGPFSRGLHVYVAGVGQQHPHFDTQGVGLQDNVRKLDLGDAA